MLGSQDLWIALALAVFFFGGKKLPELLRSVGQAMTEFKKGLATGVREEPGRCPVSTVTSAAAMPAATTMPAEAAMPTEAAMFAKPWVPMRKAVAPPTVIPVAMIPVVMIPATEPAIDVAVIAIASGRVTNGLRASGQAKTDADQQQYRYRQ